MFPANSYLPKETIFASTHGVFEVIKGIIIIGFTAMLPRHLARPQRVPFRDGETADVADKSVIRQQSAQHDNCRTAVWDIVEAE